MEHATEEVVMGFGKPPEIYELAVDNGAAKSRLGVGRGFVGGALAGAFIAFGGLLALVVSAGLDPHTGVPALVTGATFSVGLMLVVIAGAELITGNVLYYFLAGLRRRARWGDVGLQLVVTTLGAFAGSVFVAYFLAVKTGVIADASLTRLTAVATLKGVKETDWQIFLRGIGCNWLVCLAVWMALGAQDLGGKILAIFFPIMAFVAMGFDHVVANMFFLPAAHFAGVPGIGWEQVGRNLLFAGLGNAVGALVFVGCAYTYLYGPSTRAAESVTERDVTPAPGAAVPEPAMRS